MKTFYWSFVLMLLPSMAYTQTTEKENEFSMSMQIRPRAEYRNGALGAVPGSGYYGCYVTVRNAPII